MLELLIGPIASLLDKIIPDAVERDRLAHEIATMAERHAQELAKAQIEVNKEELCNDFTYTTSGMDFYLELNNGILSFGKTGHAEVSYPISQFCF